MRPALPLIVGLLWASLLSADAVETYKIDPVHSSAGFKIKHLFSKLPGRFPDVSGTIVGDPANPEQTKVDVKIKTASIDTNDAKRDEHLRSPDFFDSEQFPHITFTSKKVIRTGDDSAFVTGDLTMKGVTKEVILQVKFLGKGKDARGEVRTGWEARTALKRSEFGLTWAKAVEGTQVVGDDVEIELNIEAVQDTAPPSIETTQANPELKTPSGAVPAEAGATAGPSVATEPSTAPAFDRPAVLPGVESTASAAGAPEKPATGTQGPEHLGALPPGGEMPLENAPVPDAPAASAPFAPTAPAAPVAPQSVPAAPVTPSFPVLPAAPPVPEKAEAQSGNLPGAVPGEGSLPTTPNPAEPAAPTLPPQRTEPLKPQTEPPAQNDASKESGQTPAPAAPGGANDA